MRTWVILVFAIIFGAIFYALAPQDVNKLFSDLFRHTKSTVETTVDRVTGTADLRTEHVQLDSRPLTVQVADTDGERYQGLSGRSSLEANHGMLFVFPTVGTPTFTMRGMRFALDFVWLRAGSVTAVTENVQPPAAGEEPRTIPAPGPIDAVLEVPAGSVNAWDLGIGAELVRPAA